MRRKIRVKRKQGHEDMLCEDRFDHILPWLKPFRQNMFAIRLSHDTVEEEEEEEGNDGKKEKKKSSDDDDHDHHHHHNNNNHNHLAWTRSGFSSTRPSSGM